MIDWHSHILPEMDDGSKSVEETKALLKAQKEQGVRISIATPHFYANNESINTFLERRAKSFQEVVAGENEPPPEILLGAEVCYYQGISRNSEIKKLCLEGSKILLLEMPVGRWHEGIIKELSEMSGSGGTRIILAHIERYLKWQETKSIERLLESGVLFQANATFFTSLLTRQKALKLLKKGKIHFVGSDCHNMYSRPPKIGRAVEIISEKLGNNFINQMNEYGYAMLTKTK